MKRLLGLSFVLFSGWSGAFALDASGGLNFSFGSTVKPRFLAVSPADLEDGRREYGFLSTAPPVGDASATGLESESPFSFFVNLPEGNYLVKAVFRGDRHPVSTTVKAESRRLVLEKVEAEAGGTVTEEFVVNVRQPALPGGGSVSLNSRESGPPMTPRWDERLTLEFGGKHPAVSELEIRPAPEAVTVFLAGDSTVAEQAREPFCGWGQMLPAFFDAGVAIANHAESGLALKSFQRQKRLEKILSSLKKGDYVFVQFGHNDQKDKASDAGPFTTYKENLKTYVAAIREKKGIPVLVTPMERRRWKDGEIGSTLGDYAEAVRQAGREEEVPVIDLNAMSLKLYQALGPEGSKRAFVHYPANMFPGRDKPLKDDTHHNNFGGYELARCVVEGIREKLPALAAHLRQGIPSFDPSQPDDPEKFSIPASPTGVIETPAGS